MNNRLKKHFTAHQSNSSKLYKAGPFWQNALGKIEHEFNKNGIQNFRNSDLSLKFFVPTYGCPGNGFSEEEIQNFTKNGSDLSEKQKAFISHNFDGYNHALSDYRTFYSCNFNSDRLNLLSFSESNIGNPVEHFDFYQKIYSRSSLNYLLGLSFFQQEVPDFIPSRVLEIGGGFGTLGEILTKCGMPALKYIDVDLSPMFKIACEYTKNVFKDLKIFEYGSSSEEKLEIDKLCHLNYLPNWAIEKLQGKIDLFVNFISFQEMEPEIVKNYAFHIQRLKPEFLLLRNLKEGKQKQAKGNLGVKKPILRDDYFAFFDEYKLRASNTIPFGYKTVDGFHSELMILERK